ncbi:MAG: histidine phosphatase family protein [Proteobacteria bacterium]|nr:histidine phosphatase family protein [Pseudomonadota bacterium]MBU4296473.1 histidine phosphatase family protein [Pseudomonadota bacterium]MCG2748761.1 histidine phosphatase family protein [Desulfobulbaceae bacterium]
MWVWWVLTPTTVLVVRHGEKGEGVNPPLTLQGQERAVALAQVVKDAGIRAIYVTHTCAPNRPPNQTAICCRSPGYIATLRM